MSDPLSEDAIDGVRDDAEGDVHFSKITAVKLRAETILALIAAHDREPKDAERLRDQIDTMLVENDRLTRENAELRDYADRCSFASGIYYECDAPARAEIEPVEQGIRDAVRKAARVGELERENATLKLAMATGRGRDCCLQDGSPVSDDGTCLTCGCTP